MALKDRSDLFYRIQTIPGNKPTVLRSCEKMLIELTKIKSMGKSMIQNSNIKDRTSLIENEALSFHKNNQSAEKAQIIKTPYSDHIITVEEEKNIKKALSKYFVLNEITDDILQIVLQDIFYFTFNKAQIIYEEGDEGKFFYIVAQGKIEGLTGGKIKKIYSEWSCFGELSLITNCKREESLKCVTPVALFCLNGESFKEIQRKLNDIRLRERFNFLNTISIFKPLESILKYNVTERLKFKQFNVNEKIINKGDMGHTLFIIKSGVVSCVIEGKEVRRLTNNDYFGQNAIIINAKRGCDVIAIQYTQCFEISRNNLIEALGIDYVNSILFSFFVNSINQNTYLRKIFIESKQHQLFQSFKIKTYHDNEYIVPKDDKNPQRIIIVVEGSLFKDINKEVLYAEKGAIIGEEIFKDPSKHLPLNLFAHFDCISLEANFIDLANILKINLKTRKPMNILKRISKLKELILFRNLSEITVESIALGMTKVKYSSQDDIIKENTFGDQFFLITKGSVRISVKGKIVRDLEKGSCFGEIALLTDGEKRTATVTAIDQVVCYVISKGDFDMILENKAIKDYMIKKLSLQDTLIELTDFHLIKFLGKGKFGNVNLVHNKKNIYAIKSVSRDQVNNKKILAKYFVNERQVMLSLDHPFIVKMVKTLKNESSCFYLMEFINGINLDEYLAHLSTQHNIRGTQFYIGSLLLIIEYLQKKLIAHRDIKPSNIMIDSNGYLKMIDFGTAKVLNDYTTTVIGTPHYIPPEILIGRGYSLSCDFWSIGICMYEIFYGIYPFGHDADEEIEIYNDVLNLDIIFPSEGTKFAHVNSLIKNLLMKKVNQRLCNVSILKTKEFFQDFEWDQLIDFKLQPPYIPQTKSHSSSVFTFNPFINVFKEEPSLNQKQEDIIPENFDYNWAEEF